MEIIVPITFFSECEHGDVTVSKARQMLGFIMRVGRDFRDPYALKSLYVSLVRSKLEYASCVWIPYQNGRIARLKRVQEKFILYAMFVRYVLCARIDSSSLLGMLALTANPHRTRSRALLLERFHNPAYGLKEPLNCAIRNFNNENQYFDFCVSQEGFHELLRRNVY
jgi:hypothetical protein